MTKPILEQTGDSTGAQSPTPQARTCNEVAGPAGIADGLQYRSALAALSGPFQAELACVRTGITGSSLGLTFHGQNRWGVSCPEEPYAHATSLFFGMTPTPDDDRILYLSVRGSERVDRFAGCDGISISQTVESLRSIGKQITGFDPVDRAKFMVLISCNGCEEFEAPQGTDSRARQLSRLTGLPVLAVDGLVAVYHRPTSTRPPSIFTIARGALQVGGPQYQKPGDWKTQFSRPPGGELPAIREELERFYRELASDAQGRIVAYKDGQPRNPIERFIDQRQAAKRASLERNTGQADDESATNDEIRFMD